MAENKKHPDTELNLYQRIVSASVGALLTSMLVTPLDVVKTRLQAQVPVAEPKSAASCPRCTHYEFHNGLIDMMLPKSQNPKAFVKCECPLYFSGTFDALYKIGKYEGIFSLYNGLRPSLIMAVPSTVLYFASYDKLREILVENDVANGHVAPLLAGGSARILAATAISPLELARTKIQAVNDPPSLYKVVKTQIRTNGIRSLWQGLSPTLWRDVPFSALYWVIVEESREMIRPFAKSNFQPIEDFTVSFAGGFIGGTVAATITHPFDVVKTRRQVFDYSKKDISTKFKKIDTSSIGILRRIFQTEGFGGFFVGLGPRLGKIAPACAIMLSSYEAGKAFFLAAPIEIKM